MGTKHLKEKYDDDLLIQEGFSVFEQVCKKLNIQIIRTYSPQAKGRVERKHAIFQDRFVKDLKLYGIKTIDDANAYLERFLVKINNKFAKSCDEVPDAHREKDIYGDLSQIICWKYRRQLRNDWTIRYKGEYYQIKKGYEGIIRPGQFVVIKKYLDGKLRLRHEDEVTELGYELLRQKPEQPSKTKKYYDVKGLPADPVLISKRSRKNKRKTPWGAYNPNWLKSA